MVWRSVRVLGLTFVTLPLAFGQLPFGSFFGAVFFVLISFAAITSAISLTEPALAYLTEEYNAKRQAGCYKPGCGVLAARAEVRYFHSIFGQTFLL